MDCEFRKSPMGMLRTDDAYLACLATLSKKRTREDISERVAHLITTDKVMITGWMYESRYPEEVRVINIVAKDVDPSYRKSVHRKNVKDLVYDKLMNRENAVEVDLDDTFEPLLLYKGNLDSYKKLLKRESERLRGK